MLICIPITQDEGLQSRVSEHFGSAPMFVIFDTESAAHRVIQNGDLGHSHGMCQPLKALRGERVDAILVGGIGGGALSKLEATGVQVFLAGPPTVQATIEALKAGTLRRMTLDQTCGHHGGGADVTTLGGGSGGCCGA